MLLFASMFTLSLVIVEFVVACEKPGSVAWKTVMRGVVCVRAESVLLRAESALLGFVHAELFVCERWKRAKAGVLSYVRQPRFFGEL